MKTKKIRILAAIGIAILMTFGATAVALASSVDCSVVDLAGNSITITAGDSANVNIKAMVTGRQANNASFDVNTIWAKNGSSFTGTQPVTKNTPSREAQDSPYYYTIPCEIRIPLGTTPGTYDLVISATNIHTTAPAALSDGTDAVVHVTVKAPTPPADPLSIHAPAPVTIEASAVKTVVTAGDLGFATANYTDATIAFTADPEGYGLGDHDITWTATRNGEIATAVQHITIVDTTAPGITAPADAVAEATAFDTPKSDINLGMATASDIFPVTITNNAPSAFPLGTTTIIWTATDTSGNTATAIQTVTIMDTTKPVFTFIPADITAEATAVNTPVNIGQAEAADIFLKSVTSNAPSAFPLGNTTVLWTAEDTSGNIETAAQIVTIVDTTNPVFTFVPGNITAVYGQPINLGQAIATDIFLKSVTNDAPAVFPLGTTRITWTAEDTSGNITEAYQYVTVKYAFSGFLQPINKDGSSVFKAGSTVPVKFQLNDYNGNYVTNAVATIKYAKITNHVLGSEVEAISTSSATTGSLFRYDPQANQYIFNMSTKGLTSGTYQVTVYLDDGQSYSVTISLK